MPLCLDHNAAIATAKHVSELIVAFVQRLSVHAVQAVHSGIEVRLGRRHKQVVVRRQQTVGLTRPLVAANDVVEPVLEIAPVVVLREHFAPERCSRREVVSRPSSLHSRSPRHAPSLGPRPRDIRPRR
jgi:hypothetical protein